MNIRNKKFVIIENNSHKEIGNYIFEDILKLIKEEENLHPDCFVNLLISDDDTIRKYNKKFLGRDEKTDVMSFTANIPHIHLLGDIIIDTEVADKQKENRSLEEELRILFQHGVLHLLGYDHLAESQKKIMKTQENKYRKKLKEINKLSGR